MIKYIVSLFFLFFVTTTLAQTYTISGKITDKVTNEVLLFAECYDSISLKGTTSNAYGYYSLTLPEGKVKVVASYLGYKDVEKQFTLEKDTILNLQLILEAELLDEVIVNKRIPIHKQTLMGKISVPVNTIKAIPSFVGETDLMKSLTYLPGITNGKEGYSNIFVRGGDRGQNLILLDGIRLYNTNHIGGFLSIINSDILKQVDVYKGGFPARYGGRSSSVIDLYTKDGTQNKLRGKFSLGVLTSSLLLEAPVNDKISFYFAARSSYYDLFTLKKRRIYKKTGREGYFGYTIFDINSKINWNISDQNSFSLSFYTGHDYQSSADETFGIEKSYGNLRIHNTGVALNQYWTIRPKLFLKNTLSYSNYSTTLENIEEGDFYYNYATQSTINDITWQSRLEFSPNTKHSIKTGIETSYYSFKPGVQTIISDNANGASNVTSGFTKNITSVESSLYVEDEIRFTEKIRLNMGLRGTTYKPKDTVFYRLEPRFSFRWLASSNISFKANYTLMNQYNHSLVNNYQGFEKEIWLAATKDLIPQRANQISGGIFYSNEEREIEVSLEAYYKKMSNLLEYHSPTSDEDNLSNLENIVAKNGKGEAYGIETQIKKETENLSASINYTLSWNYRKFVELNNGNKYPFIYDRRHNLSFLASYKLDKYYTLTTNFNISTGTPTTLPVAFVSSDDFSYEYFVYEGINNRRLPLYHRLDLSINRVKHSKKGNKRQVSLNIFNVYARQNPVYIFFDMNTGKVKQKSLFSILPTLSYSLEF